MKDGCECGGECEAEGCECGRICRGSMDIEGIEEFARLDNVDAAWVAEEGSFDAELGAVGVGVGSDNSGSFNDDEYGGEDHEYLGEIRMHGSDVTVRENSVWEVNRVELQ